MLDENPPVVVTMKDPATGRMVTVDVTVNEITMRALAPFTRACKPFFTEFSEGGRLADSINQETGDVTKADPMALFEVLSDHSDAFMVAASLVSDHGKAFFEQLPADQFFLVAARVVEVNGSFFIRSLAPALVAVAETLGKLKRVS